LRLVACACVLALALSVPAVADENDGRYRDFGDPGGFWSIVPPGQQGVWSADEALAGQVGAVPEHVDNQLGMYANLVHTTPGFSADDLPAFFKDGSFGVADDDVGRMYRPDDRDDVVVIRDANFGVPHIFGDTREGTMFASGYTAAEDRLFLMDVLRHVGRAELSAFLGPSEGNLALDRDQMRVAPYVEEDLTAQIEQGREMHGELGELIHADATAYIAGVNLYIAEALADPDKLPAEYPALQKVPREFVLEDIVAIASLVGGIFGTGGGREVANLCAIHALSTEIGDDDAHAVFGDFAFADDAEAPVHTDRAFPYMSDLGPPEREAVPDLDCDTLEPLSAPPPGPEHVADAVFDLVPSPPVPAARTGTIDFPWGSVDVSFDGGMSNALLVGAERTDSGAPIAVFGPQTGYFIPQLLVEKGIYGPGIRARGVSFAGTDLYVQLGRGTDYAWSATSAGADNVDEFVLRLCDPDGGEATTDSMGYLHDGDCKAIEELQEVRIAQVTAAGIPDSEESLENVVVNKYFQRAPDYGPVTARGQTSDGTPIAIARSRTTYFDELGSARGFLEVNDPDFMADGFASFRRAFGQGVDYTFNWFYVDADDIGYQVSCLCPQRAEGVDPYLPAWGTGEWDWHGTIDRGALPWDHNPERGYIVSWNNKQAPEFLSSDSQFGWGPIHRSDLLESRLREPTDVSVGEAVAYHWDFGDGTESNLAEPQKTYTHKGIYTVTLTASSKSKSHKAFHQLEIFNPNEKFTGHYNGTSCQEPCEINITPHSHKDSIYISISSLWGLTVTAFVQNNQVFIPETVDYDIGTFPVMIWGNGNISNSTLTLNYEGGVFYTNAQNEIVFMATFNCQFIGPKSP
jgi:hypothetical protein